ncbi:MAG: hypothetical protein GYA47_09935, partial [Desulfovibrio sp.]|nr:hypothetical protein [Desulfovibrio sp.]
MITIDSYVVRNRKIVVSSGIDHDQRLKSFIDNFRLPFGICLSKECYSLKIELRSIDNLDDDIIVTAEPISSNAFAGARRPIILYPQFQKKMIINDDEHWIWVVTSDDDKFKAQQLLAKYHFRGIPNRGMYIAISNSRPSVRDKIVLGCAVLDKLTFSVIPYRDEFLSSANHKIVNCHSTPLLYGIAWASRFVVDQTVPGIGIGGALAKSLLSIAARYYVPSCDYVEVYASTKYDWRSDYVNNGSVPMGFLGKAGYNVCPRA